MAVKILDKTGLGYFLGKIKAWCNATFAAITHNQASNTINVMTGYSKPSSGSAIAASDSLNNAIGKLEAKVDAVDDSNYVHKTNDETIAGTKTFSSTITGSVSGNAGTATQFSANTTVALTGDATGTSAGSKKGWSVPVTLSNSGVTAGSYGPSDNATPGYGTTFNVPYITVDAKGRVTAAATHTIKIPASDDTNNKVSQTVSTENLELPLLAKDSNATSTVTSGSKFAAAVKLNPSTGTITATKFVGSLTGGCSGNAGSATKLATTRAINGTNFDGSAAITTANWGTARNISISDSDGTNTGAAVSVNGSANATLKLPATIKASITGNCSGSSGSCTGNAATATTATKANALASSVTPLGNGLIYTTGGLTLGSSAGQLYKGSSNNAALISAPENGTYYSSTAGNVQNLRLTWSTDGKYLTDIFASPNDNFIWHRNVSNGTARPWRRLVEENASGITAPNWNISIAGSSGSCTGNATTATKLATARSISAGNLEFQGSANFDGSGNINLNITQHRSIVTIGNTNNYPFHRIAYTAVETGNYIDRAITFFVGKEYISAGYGICRIILRTNNASSDATAQCEVQWLARTSGIPVDAIQVGFNNTAKASYVDVFYKSSGSYNSAICRVLSHSNSRTSVGQGFTVVSASTEASNTTASDPLTSTESYATIAAAGTKIRGKAYTSTITASDSGVIGSANSCTGNAATVSGTAGTSTLAWNSEVTLYTVGGHAIKAKLPANPNTNTDTLVTQNVSTTNARYPILCCPTADATANQGAKTSIFASGVKVRADKNELMTIGADAHIRQVQGNYGVFWRNDGSSYYLLKTASGDAYGSWDSTRPLIVNLSNGVCNINGNAATATKLGTSTVGSASMPIYLNGGTATACSYSFSGNHSNLTKGTNPSSTVWTHSWIRFEKTGTDTKNRLTEQRSFVNSSGVTGFEIGAYDYRANQTGSGWIGIYNNNGTVYTAAPTPATSDNSTKIATTAFVKAQGYSTSTNIIPVGAIIYYAKKATPANYLICNGAAVSRTTYATLFGVIGTTYGTGDGSTTFNVPNLIDRFPQGNATPGTVKAAGLPNITGGFGDVSANGSMGSYFNIAWATGAFYQDDPHTGWRDGWTNDYNTNGFNNIAFNASRSSSIYGGSTTVQPPALTLVPCIRYA